MTCRIPLFNWHKTWPKPVPIKSYHQRIVKYWGLEVHSSRLSGKKKVLYCKSAQQKQAGKSLSLLWRTVILLSNFRKLCKKSTIFDILLIWTKPMQTCTQSQCMRMMKKKLKSLISRIWSIFVTKANFLL